jgi:hypothetical protein
LTCGSPGISSANINIVRTSIASASLEVAEPVAVAVEDLGDEAPGSGAFRLDVAADERRDVVLDGLAVIRGTGLDLIEDGIGHPDVQLPHLPDASNC